MIIKVYAVFDKAIDAFMMPIYARSHGEAKRRFVESVKGDVRFAANAPDYGLFWLSDFNDSTGDFGVEAEAKLNVPLQIMTGLEALSAANRPASPERPRVNSGPTELDDVGMR